jgi:general secretion pathway protein B
MSTILDALRKTQSEQTVAKGQSMTGTESLLVHRTASRHAVSSRTLISVFCCLVLLALTGWFLFGPSQKTIPVKPIRVQTATATPAPSASLQTPATIPAAPIAVVAPPPARPAQQMTPAQPSLKALPKPVSVAPVKQSQPSSTADDDSAGSPRTIRRSQGGTTTPIPPAPVTPAVSSSPEGVKLTGIAWQDIRNMRRAVVNDLLVGEGAVIAGAKVLEIKPAMVRFEKGGIVYETALPH